LDEEFPLFSVPRPTPGLSFRCLSFGLSKMRFSPALCVPSLCLSNPFFIFPPLFFPPPYRSAFFARGPGILRLPYLIHSTPISSSTAPPLEHTLSAFELRVGTLLCFSPLAFCNCLRPTPRSSPTLTARSFSSVRIRG